MSSKNQRPPRQLTIAEGYQSHPKLELYLSYNLASLLESGDKVAATELHEYIARFTVGYRALLAVCKYAQGEHLNSLSPTEVANAAGFDPEQPRRIVQWLWSQEEFSVAWKHFSPTANLRGSVASTDRVAALAGVSASELAFAYAVALAAQKAIELKFWPVARTYPSAQVVWAAVNLKDALAAAREAARKAAKKKGIDEKLPLFTNVVLERHLLGIDRHPKRARGNPKITARRQIADVAAIAILELFDVTRPNRRPSPISLNKVLLLCGHPEATEMTQWLNEVVKKA